MTNRAFDQRFASIYNDLERFPSLDHVAEEMGCSTKTVKNRAGEMRSLRVGGLDVPDLISRVGTGRGASQPQGVAADEIEGDAEDPQFYRRDLIEPRRIDPLSDRVRHVILTWAQDASEIHDDFLTNVEAYADWLGDAQILISGGTYGKSFFEDHSAEGGYYHKRVEPYLTNDQIEIGEGLVFCGEMNTLPTATMPLSGFETYTRSKWGIFPHAKIQLQAVATAKFARTKQLLTTGAVTMPNYIPKKAGIKASFHHQIGAIIVELMPDGSFYCRHLHADGLAADEGGFYDLDRRIERGVVTEGHRVEAISYGDIHHEKLDPEVALTTWGYDTETGNVITAESLLDRLQPKHQFFHDLSDFSPRNHHNIKDPHFLFKTHKHGTDNVELALQGCAEFLARTKRDFCQSVVVQSNHDNALLRWLKEADYRQDPVNALFFLEAQTSYYRQLESGVSDPPIFEQVLREFLADRLAGVRFVSEDDSYMVLNVEHAMHGHLGSNGARGNPRHYTKMGSKSTTGHTHSPQIVDGAFVSGVSGSRDMGYNRGLSSWDHSHTILYPSGARTILTMMEGRWFAPRP